MAAVFFFQSGLNFFVERNGFSRWNRFDLGHRRSLSWSGGQTVEQGIDRQNKQTVGNTKEDA